MSVVKGAIFRQPALRNNLLMLQTLLTILSFKSVPTSEKAYGFLSVATTSKDADGEVENSINGKIRRRTCYVCGEKGHLSSVCPKNQAAHPTKATHDFKSVPTSKKTDGFLSVPLSEDADDEVENSISGKIRRRTCYECGEKGHLSSTCPKKQAADATNSTKNTEDFKFVRAGEKADGFLSVSTISKEADTEVENSISRKIRRRTCYECGEKGRLSSACPKKQAADATNSTENTEDFKPVPTDGVLSVPTIVKEDDGEVENSISGKIRRRTCYECGEEGHLPSSCPKKQDAGLKNPSTN